MAIAINGAYSSYREDFLSGAGRRKNDKENVKPTEKEAQPAGTDQNEPERKTAADENRTANSDTVEISKDARHLYDLQKSMETSDTNNVSAPEDEANEPSEEDNESTSSKTSMAINVGKLARRLAAAKTRSQVQSVLTAIQSDLRECESGKAQGADVDEESVAAAERLLQQAEQRLSEVDGREPTPEEETASALASLF